MKPVYLEFGGLNSFEEKAQIDFSKLLSGGVFGIFGDTGSGKSTILDSIHFALYGEIDRAPKSFTDCINDHSDSAFVTFDFEILTDGVRRTYRVKRERRRKNGTTKAYLYEKSGENDWLALAEGTREVDERIEQIVGLTFSDFKTCIALPQGDFAALVKSTAAERVKLVARLFNLEKYGERLFRAVNERYTAAEEEVNRITAKMEENEGGDETLFQALSQEIARLVEEVDAGKKIVAQADERAQKLTAIQKEKAAFDRLKTRLTEMEKRVDEMCEKRAMLEKYPKALLIKEKADERKDAETQKTLAKARAENAKTAYERAKETQERAKRYLAEQDFEKQILEISLQLQKVKEGAADRAHAQKAQAEYNACVAEYRAIKDKYPFEEFDKKRAEIEEKRTALGEDKNLLDYLKHHYKGVLLADTYGEIRQDLQGLQEKYPQTEEDIRVLLQKYALSVESGNVVDIAQIQLAFKEQELQRKRLQTEWEELEERRKKYEQNEKEKALIEKHGKLLKQNVLLAQEKISDLQNLEGEAILSSKLEKSKCAQEKAKREEEIAQKTCNERFAETQTQEELFAVYTAREKELCEGVKTLLTTHGFVDETEVITLLHAVGDAERLDGECKRFFEEYEWTKRQLAEKDVAVFVGFDEGQLQEALVEQKAAKQAQEIRTRTLNFKEASLERLKGLREKYKEQAKLLTEKRKNLQVCDTLRQLLRGNKFLEFIASEYLQEVCLAASKTLLSLTGGRYFLQYDKEFKVGDNRDGGNLRAVKTLSGGETFLVSLSLALSLSASICQKSRRPIEFFFLDEGFGTLDEKLVETVMDVLGKLSKSFSVGLISHVEELKRRIENKILVSGATESKGSTLRVETY